MKLISILLLVLVAVMVIFSVYVRRAPSDPGVWHVDPTALASLPEEGRYLLAEREGAHGPAPILSGSPEEVLARFDAVALASPRVSLLAGSVAEGHVTYVARSAGFGFPDYVSVKAEPVEGGTKLTIYSRLRFGRSDLGVNKKRIDAWLAAMG